MTKKKTAKKKAKTTKKKTASTAKKKTTKKKTTKKAAKKKTAKKKTAKKTAAKKTAKKTASRRSGKNLVIVESPAKAKTINKFLGSNYIVTASMGHVRDLPEKSLGIDDENGFKPKYKTSTGRKKTIDALIAAVKGADRVFLATDPDREGEAIAWHLFELLKKHLGNDDEFHRVTFHEITK